MKIKVTHPIQTDTELLQAGIVYDVPDEKAIEYIENNMAVEVVEETIKPKKVKYADR